MCLGKKFGIVDADIYGFSVPDMMGIEDRPVVRGDAIYPPERFGVKVISMGFFVEDNSPIIWRGPMLGKMLNNFLKEVEWRSEERRVGKECRCRWRRYSVKKKENMRIVER